MLSLPLRRLGWRSTAFACALALFLTAAALAVANVARAAADACTRRNRWGRCGRSPITIAGSRGSSSAPRMPRGRRHRFPTGEAPIAATCTGRSTPGRGGPTAPSDSRSARCTSASRCGCRPRPGCAHRPSTRLLYSRRLALSLRKIYPGRVTRTLRLGARAHRHRHASPLAGAERAAAAILVSQHAVRACADRRLAERRVPLHPPLRGSLDRQHRQRVLRRPADGHAVHGALRPRIRRPLGHRRQLALLGAARGCRPGARFRAVASRRGRTRLVSAVCSS